MTRRNGSCSASGDAASSVITEIIDDDSMPGFEEHEIGQRDDAFEAVIDLTIAEHDLAQNAPILPAADTSVKQPGPEIQECPICGKEMETDNLGLNAHIDFCLSKNVIKEATKERITTNGTSKPLLAWTVKKGKPSQKGRRK